MQFAYTFAGQCGFTASCLCNSINTKRHGCGNAGGEKKKKRFIVCRGIMDEKFMACGKGNFADYDASKNATYVFIRGPRQSHLPSVLGFSYPSPAELEIDNLSTIGGNAVRRNLWLTK